MNLNYILMQGDPVSCNNTGLVTIYVNILCLIS